MNENTTLVVRQKSSDGESHVVGYAEDKWEAHNLIELSMKRYLEGFNLDIQKKTELSGLSVIVKFTPKDSPVWWVHWFAKRME